jgi:hypothetical protein
VQKKRVSSRRPSSLPLIANRLVAGIAGTILPWATLPSFAVVGKSHEQEVNQFLSNATAAPGGLLICVLFVPIIRIALIDQVSMQVSQLIDSIGPADRFVIVRA